MNIRSKPALLGEVPITLISFFSNHSPLLFVFHVFLFQVHPLFIPYSFHFYHFPGFYMYFIPLLYCILEKKRQPSTSINLLSLLSCKAHYYDTAREVVSSCFHLMSYQYTLTKVLFSSPSKTAFPLSLLLTICNS